MGQIDPADMLSAAECTLLAAPRIRTYLSDEVDNNGRRLLLLEIKFRDSF